MSNQIVKIKISDIIIGDRKRKNFDGIEDLAESINELGHLQPVLVDSEMHLIAGERRIKAVTLLGREDIDSIIIPIEQIADRESLEYAENNSRKDFTASEKVDIAIAIEKKVKELGDRRGKKGKDIDNNEDTNVVNRHNMPETGEKTRDFVAKRAGFKSTYAYRCAREVTEKAIPEVVEAMDRDEVSISGAHSIAQLSKRKQLSALEKAKTRPDSDTTELAKSQNGRRAAKRKEKNSIPKTRLLHLCHRIIRVAPNWDTMIPADILETPVNDFADPRLALVAVECDNRHLADAIDLLAHWDFTYTATVTVWNPKMQLSIMELTTSEPWHIVFGLRRGSGEVGEVIRFTRLVKASPVIEKKGGDLADSLIPIIEGMFPDHKKDRRIDMSASDSRKGWIIWKNTYGDPDTAAAHIAEVDAEISNEQEFDDAPLTESDGIPVEQQEAQLTPADDLPDALPELDGEEAETFEPPTKKRNLSIFSE